MTVRENEAPSQKGHGFKLTMGPFARDPVVGALPLMTVYFRLHGKPGEVSSMAFCDGEVLKRGPEPCSFNGIADVSIRDFCWPLLSTRNRDGLLTILDGPATHPDRPPEPPEAVVYPEVPTSDEVNLRVRIADAVGVPGERNVPVEVHVTADVEYTGVVIPIDFDERYVRVARVEDHFASGTASFDNEDAVPGAQSDEGYVVIASSILGKRRIAAAGEELHAATLYLDILEGASEVPQTLLEARPVGGRAGSPFVVVRHLEGSAAEPVEVGGQFGAVSIEPGVLALRASAETVPGDANWSGGFDISDPIAVLGYLFLGGEALLCPPAADYNGDGEVMISDPIRMLGVLFGGEAPPTTRDGGLVTCR